MDFVGSLHLLPAVKDPLRNDEVIAMSLVYYFFGTQYFHATIVYGE